MEGFAVTCPLAPNVPHLISGSCSSPRAFGLGFLQTPSHDDALALLLTFGSAITWFGDLHPVSSVPCPAHTSSIPAGIMADRFGKKRVIFWGFVLFAFLYYGFGVATDQKAIWFLFGLYGLFMGLTEGIQKAFLAGIIPSDFKATAFGIYNTAVGLAMFPASLLGGWLWDNISPAATFYFGATTATLAAVLFIVFMIAIKRSSPPVAR